MNDINVIVPVRNRGYTVLECLESAIAHTVAPHRIIFGRVPGFV